MSYKAKYISINEPTCERFIARMLKQEKAQTSKKSPVHEKISSLMRQSITISNQRPKPKFNTKPNSPPTKLSPLAATVNEAQGEGRRERLRERGDELSPLRESPKAGKPRNRSKSRESESWGQLLRQHRSKDRCSTFSNFDPLRTLHFLSKELQIKLQSTLPEESELHQMVTDIQHALKRIPPEISTMLHPQFAEIPLKIWVQELEKASGKTNKSPEVAHKLLQTPPTLYQEDTDKFQKIMNENTKRLEASCKQLEVVCSNLQNEKEVTEKELDEARDHAEILCKRVKELEVEMEEITSMKIKQLEEEKDELKRELQKARDEIDNNPVIIGLKKKLDDLQKQKLSSDKTCAQLEYDITLLNMEKEKFITMLSLRDGEVKEIQEEMIKLQDQVNRQLTKLNTDVVFKIKAMKSGSDPFLGLPQDINKEFFNDFGDATISSISTNETEKGVVNSMKESPCGDAAGLAQNQDPFFHRFREIKSSTVELDLPAGKDHESALEDLLKGMTPSCKAFLNGAL